MAQRPDTGKRAPTSCLFCSTWRGPASPMTGLPPTRLVVEQPAAQGACRAPAAHPPAWLQLADGRRDVTGKDGRVRPLRIGERGRCDVLRLRVQGTCVGVDARICHCAPGAGEDLLGPPGEQERVGAL